MSKFRDIVESIIAEMAYPANFSMDEFKSLTSFAARVQYCKERLKYLGQGSSRMAFQVDDDKVLKLAKNKKGIAQNVAEWQNTPDMDIFANVIDRDFDGLWVEMELAKKAKKSDFKRFLGLDERDLWSLLTEFHFEIERSHGKRVNRPNLTPAAAAWYEKYIIETDEDHILKELYQYCTDWDSYYPPEYAKIQNWGIVERDGQERLVIIDNGYDRESSKAYIR